MSKGGPRSEKALACQLHEWLTTEMHFHPQGLYRGAPAPTAEQLRKICRGTHQADIWNFVLNNVRSVQTVRKVKGNLQLKASSHRHGYKVKYGSERRYDDERQKLLAQKEQLQEETSSLLSDIGQVEQELERMEADIQSAETEYQRDMEGFREVGRRACLLQVFCRSTDNFAATLDTFSDRLMIKADALLSTLKGVDTALHNREEEEGRGEEEEEGGGRETRPLSQLETSTARDVRASCEYINKFLHQTLQGSFGKDKSSFQLSKEQLWRQVETTLANHSIEQIVKALERQSQREAQLLREHTSKVNIQKDAEKLRFKYEKGGVLRDTSAQPSVLQSVHQLLEESQLRHVLRFVEAEKHTNDARPLLEHLDQTRGKINSLIKQRFTSQPGTAQIASMWVDCLLDVEGDRTAREVYMGEMEGLRERLHKEQTAQDAILSLHSKIQHFQELANAKQNLIQVVAKQNAGAKSRHTAQQLHVTEYIQRSIPDHPMETGVLASSLRGRVVEEVNRLSTLSLPYLMHLHLNSETKLGMLDLSINFTSHPEAVRVREALHHTLHRLHIPPHKAPECILKHCMSLKEERDNSQQRSEEQRKLWSSIQMTSGVTTDMDNLTELCDKVKAIDKEEQEKLLPVLHKRLGRAARASTECIKLKDYMQSWWELPAQFCTPWVTVEDLTLEQWHNKWKVMATNLRQMDLHRPSALLER